MIPGFKLHHAGRAAMHLGLAAHDFFVFASASRISYTSAGPR
jgi:hypothetical protein